MFRVVTLQCLTEIATINVGTNAQYEDKLRGMFFATVKEVRDWLIELNTFTFYASASIHCFLFLREEEP